MTEGRLRVAGLRVSADGLPILRDATFALTPGELVTLEGPSGLGKSTLLRALVRLAELEPGLRVEGEAWLDGQPIFSRATDPDTLRRQLGLLFQRPVVFPRSLRGNLVLPLRYGPWPRRSWPERMEHALTRVGLWNEVRHRLDAPATILSIGQQQRLCLARALVNEPRALLLDEPTSALDPEATEAVERLLVRLRADVPILMVTHDPAQATRIADRRLCLAATEEGAVLRPVEPVAVSPPPAVAGARITPLVPEPEALP